jgi:hypothetical protein
MRPSLTILNMMAILAFSSCVDGFLGDCGRGAGPLLREKRDVAAFHTIRLEENVNLHITEDSICSIEVESGQHLLPGIITEVRDSQLFITDRNRCDWVRNLQNKSTVYVRLPGLRHISQLGSGNMITNDTLHFPCFTIEIFDGGGSTRLLVNNHRLGLKIHDGTADITAFGKTDDLYIFNSGYGPVDCIGLAGRKTEIHSESTNNSCVWSLEELRASIFAPGNIYYKGDPGFIHTNIQGTGRLIRL